MEQIEILKTLRVVYVEDNDDVRENIIIMLKRRFKEVMAACNGKEGLELVLQHNPDIVITDLEMPVMDGMQMIKEIRKTQKELPIVVITAHRDEAYKTELADGYVYKPIDKNELFTTITEIAQKICK